MDKQLAARSHVKLVQKQEHGVWAPGTLARFLFSPECYRCVREGEDLKLQRAALYLNLSIDGSVPI